MHCTRYLKWRLGALRQFRRDNFHNIRLWRTVASVVERMRVQEKHQYFE